jgi:hypothetical protein
MHLMQYKFSYLISALLVVSCDSVKKDELDIPTIPLEPGLENIPFSLSEIAGDIQIVHLETNTESSVGFFSSLAHLDENHIIFRSNKTVLVFDREGRFLNKIDALGNGPMEYNTLTGVYVDHVRQQIHILDYEDIKVYKYDGKYIKTLKPPLSVRGMIRNGKGEFIFSCNQIYKKKDREMLFRTDTTLKIEQTYKSKNPDVCSDINQNLFYSVHPYLVKKRLFYKEPFVDTIYQVTDTDLIPHWVIDMSGIGFSTCDGINTEMYREASKNKIPPIGLKETDRYFFINYNFNKAKYVSLYDKELNIFRFHRKFTREDFSDPAQPTTLGFTNDLIKDSPLFWPAYVNEEVMVSLVDPVSLGEKALAAFDCKEDDNSLLLIAKLK